MQTVEAQTVIHAPREAVWKELTNGAAYRQWNPFIRRLDGRLEPGRKITVRVEPPGSSGITFRPTVQTVEAPRRLAWLGRFGLPHLFDGRHEFVLEALDDDRTRLIQRETFGGVLVPVMLRRASVESGFEAMNEALKNRVEAEQPVET